MSAMENTNLGVSAELAAMLQETTATVSRIKQIETDLAAISASGAEIISLASLAKTAQTQITDEQAVIAAKSAHIQKAQDHADTVRANLDRALTAAKQQQTEAEGFRASAQASSETCTQLLAAITSGKTSGEKDAEEIRSILSQAKESAAKAKSLADRAAEIETRVAEYERRLLEFQELNKEQLKAIEALLPGATSAGLAHAFDERRKTFLTPSVRWQWLFVGSVISLVLLSLTGLLHVYSVGDGLTYDSLLRLWLARLPIAGALIWLALYASRESALAKRLEEDYGYKAAVAASFQGFHKQMSEIAGSANGDSPLVKLCADTLATLAMPPGRIYDKHALVVSPGKELTDAATGIIEATKK